MQDSLNVHKLKFQPQKTTYLNKMKIISTLLTLITLWIFLVSTNIQKSDYLNPTGTYNLDSKTEKKGNDIYGYTGQIQVKAITKTRIAITLGVNKGAPSYNSGTLIDTLDYFDDVAIYKDTNPQGDASCKITFSFNPKGVNVTEKTADYNMGCGFGHAVVASGFYKKTSSAIPVLTNPGTGEEIK